MLSEAGQLGEGFPASGAGIGFGGRGVVSPPVRPEVPHLPETLPAVAALVRLLSRVKTLVFLSRGQLGEALPTSPAAVGTLSRVNPHVFLQVYRLAETLPAVGAAVRRLSGVNSLVPLKIPRVVESPAAVGAPVRGPRGGFGVLHRVRNHRQRWRLKSARSGPVPVIRFVLFQDFLFYYHSFDLFRFDADDGLGELLSYPDGFGGFCNGERFCFGFRFFFFDEYGLHLKPVSSLFAKAERKPF